MKYSVSRLNVSAAVAEGVRPALVLDDTPGAPWWVLARSMDLASQARRGLMVREMGNAVRIGLFPYLCHGDPVHLAGFALQFGFHLASLFTRRPEELLLVLGILDASEQLRYHPQCQLWLGCAVRCYEAPCG
jgi:hypothetical protein